MWAVPLGNFVYNTTLFIYKKKKEQEQLILLLKNRARKTEFLNGLSLIKLVADELKCYILDSTYLVPYNKLWYQLKRIYTCNEHTPQRV